jgi:hypothetical protein
VSIWPEVGVGMLKRTPVEHRENGCRESREGILNLKFAIENLKSEHPATSCHCWQILAMRR